MEFLILVLYKPCHSETAVIGPNCACAVSPSGGLRLSNRVRLCPRKRSVSGPSPSGSAIFFQPLINPLRRKPGSDPALTRTSRPAADPPRDEQPESRCLSPATGGAFCLLSDPDLQSRHRPFVGDASRDRAPQPDCERVWGRCLWRSGRGSIRWWSGKFLGFLCPRALRVTWPCVKYKSYRNHLRGLTFIQRERNSTKIPFCFYSIQQLWIVIYASFLAFHI